MTILLTLICLGVAYMTYQLHQIKKLVTPKRPLDEVLDEDELYEEAKRVVLEAGKASTSYLQRKLGIGYSRAASLIDTLEEQGVIGQQKGAKPREVLIKATKAVGSEVDPVS